jgi:hypothetical protein
VHMGKWFYWEGDTSKTVHRAEPEAQDSTCRDCPQGKGTHEDLTTLSTTRAFVPNAKHVLTLRKEPVHLTLSPCKMPGTWQGAAGRRGDPCTDGHGCRVKQRRGMCEYVCTTTTHINASHLASCICQRTPHHSSK